MMIISLTTNFYLFIYFFIYLFIYMLIDIRLIDTIFTRILMFSIRTSRQVPVMVSAAF